MRKEDDQTFQLIGFLQDGFTPNLRKAKLSNSVLRWFMGYSKLDRVYRLLSVSEMLLWTRLGEAIGYFPPDTAEKLWVSTHREMSIFAHNIIQSTSHLQRELGYWSLICEATKPGFFDLYSQFSGPKERNRQSWAWFRTQLLLAQRFGKYRPSKILLASLVILDDDKWSSLLYRLYASTDRIQSETTRSSVEHLLTYGRTDIDQDVGLAPSTPAEVIAGFLLTLNEIQVRNTYGRSVEFDPDLDSAAQGIKASRLNFGSRLIMDRFLSLIKFAERYGHQFTGGVLNHFRPLQRLFLSKPDVKESVQLLIEQWHPAPNWFGFTDLHAPSILQKTSLPYAPSSIVDDSENRQR